MASVVRTCPGGLGLGLEQLLGPASAEPAEAAAGSPSALALAQLQHGKYRPRTRMDEGVPYELAESIRAQGGAALARAARGSARGGPLRGHRWQAALPAARLAGIAEVPVLVRGVDTNAAAAMALIENIQREDLSPLDQAQGLHRLVQGFSLTDERAAQVVGRSRSAAANLLRLPHLA